MTIAKRFSAAVLAAGITVLGLSGAATAKEWKSVTIALEGAYAPWNLTNPDGSIGGFEPELAKYLCAHAKLECKLIAQDWSGMITALNAGKFDVMMDAVSITEERKQVIAFSAPYAHTHAVFATTAASRYANAPGTGTVVKMEPDLAGAKPTIDSLRAKFKGTTIGIQAATVYAPFIHKNFGDVATIREYKTGAERDLDLQNDRIDVAFDDAVYLKSAFETAGTPMAFTGPEIGGTIFGIGEGLGLRKSDPELKALFDAAIAAALADGTVRTLSMKWFKTDVTP